MPQTKRRQGVTDEYIRPVKGKRGYAAFAKALEVRGGPKRARIGDGEKVYRKYHLTDEKVESVLARWHAVGKFVSPYCKSVTTDLLNALAALGLNKIHESARVVGVMRRAMSAPGRVRDGVSDWTRFADKPKRTDNGKTAPGRLETLVRNLRRTQGSGSPYPEGRKLEQVGCCVDLFIREWEDRKPHQDPDKAAAGETQLVSRRDVYFRLNTHSTVPQIIRIDHPEEIEDYPVDLRGQSLGPE